MTKIAICGALGRMGTTIANLVNDADDLTFVGGVDIREGSLLGQPVYPSTDIRTISPTREKSIPQLFTVPQPGPLSGSSAPS
jgi:4-hydroxy-tetrahydrodipicolinate reductase